MMTETCIKMSARRSLASLLGEPDHEQNKTDCAYWNNFFDGQFRQRWGIDPKRDLLDSTKWKRVAEDDVPKAYKMRSLDMACNPKRSRRTQQLEGLNGAIGAGSPVVPFKPLSEVTNSVMESGATTTLTRAVTPSKMDDFMMERSCDSPIATSKSPNTPPLQSSPVSESESPSPSSTSSRKRKQTTMPQYFPNTKRAKLTVTAKRQLIN